MPDEFAAILARVRQGDEAALMLLIQRYEPEVRIAARVRLGAALRPHLDSMDVVQSVHRELIAGLRADKFDLSSPEKLIGLAVTLVKRKIARHWRRLRLQERAGAECDLRQQLLALCAPEADPGSAVGHADTVDHFLNGLEEVDRRFLNLRIEGHTTAEAARRLGVDAACLRVRLSRLRKRLLASGLLDDWL